MSVTLARTVLADWHASHGGRMVDFAGWWMPVQYTSIVAEHQATRTAAGLFDVSHMGRLRFHGPGAAQFLDRLLTRRVTDMPIGAVRYSLVTNREGGILDDVLVYRLQAAGASQSYYQLVVNASNREKIVAWIAANEAELSAGLDVGYEDRTYETAMIAVQGPRAIGLIEAELGVQASALKYYSALDTTVAGVPMLVSRTGYTGEDGCELVMPAEEAPAWWQKLLDAGQAEGVSAVGLGARDTLRLEAGMPLYGHELSEQIDPYTAGLGSAVSLPGREFLGSERLAKTSQRTDLPRRIGLKLTGKRVPREHFVVQSADGGQRIGEITSGTFSPTLNEPIAMAYVDAAHATIGGPLGIDVRGRSEPAVVVPLPFYRRPKPTAPSTPPSPYPGRGPG